MLRTGSGGPTIQEAARTRREPTLYNFQARYRVGRGLGWSRVRCTASGAVEVEVPEVKEPDVPLPENR